MPKIVKQRLVNKTYRIKHSHIEFLKELAAKKSSGETNILRDLLDICVENKDNVEAVLYGTEKIKSENLKNNMAYVCGIIDTLMEKSFKKNQDITADLLAKYAIVNLENFYIFKSFLCDKYKSNAIDDKITEFRKKAIYDLKGNSVIKEILEDLKKEGFL